MEAKPPKPSKRPWTEFERRLAKAHARREHKEQPIGMCPICRDPDYWVKLVRYLNWQFDHPELR